MFYPLLRGRYLGKLLSVVLLQPIESKGSGTSLAIAKLRAFPPEGEKHAEIRQVIRDAVKRQTTLDIEDITTNEVD